MDKYTIKAGADTKMLAKNAAVMAVVTAAVIVGLILCVFNIVKFNLIYFIAALLGTIIGILYLTISINSIFAKYIATDGKKIYIKNWENGFVPYNIYSDMKIIRDFIPARSEISSVAIKDIRKVIYGIPAYVLRNNPDRIFTGMYEKIKSELSEREFANIEKLNILYIMTERVSSCFIIASGLKKDKIIDILELIENKANIQIKSSDRDVVNILISRRRSNPKRRIIRVIDNDKKLEKKEETDIRQDIGKTEETVKKVLKEETIKDGVQSSYKKNNKKKSTKKKKNSN